MFGSSPYSLKILQHGLFCNNSEDLCLIFFLFSYRKQRIHINFMFRLATKCMGTYTSVFASFFFFSYSCRSNVLSFSQHVFFLAYDALVANDVNVAYWKETKANEFVLIQMKWCVVMYSNQNCISRWEHPSYSHRSCATWSMKYLTDLKLCRYAYMRLVASFAKYVLNKRHHNNQILLK